MDTKARIEQFRGSLSSNLLAPDDFIDWDHVLAQVSKTKANAANLQAILEKGPLSPKALREGLLDSPQVYSILMDLLAFNSTGAQVEKWGLPQTVNPNRVDWLVGQLFYVGIGHLFAEGSRVTDMLRVVEIYKDANRRRFRAGKKLEEKVTRIVRNAIKEANEQLGGVLTSKASTLSDYNLRRSLAFVIAKDNRPLIGIATVFQNQSGGRQQRDLSVTYPSLQGRLTDEGVDLVLIVDGQGLKEASDRTIYSLFEGVRYPVTLDQAGTGTLKDVLIEAATGMRPEPVDQAALNRLIDEGLRVKTSIDGDDLPVENKRARLALSSYAETRRTASLSLAPSGDRLSWANAKWVDQARQLKRNFVAADALNLFVEMLGSEIQTTHKNGNTVACEISAPSASPFNELLHITADVKALDIEKAREVGRRSMENAPLSNVAIYLTLNSLDESQVQQHRKDQILLPANVISVSANLLEQMAYNSNPLNRLMDSILTQSDLTKVSPFILSNPTSSRMFYGREAEAATVQTTLATNSVAILGSRRIGKTSLIRRLRDNLERSNFQPFFGDCQTVKTWFDFAELARKSWKVDVPDDFRPSNLNSLVEQLQGRGEGPVVLILDEIDQLIEWDQTHSEDLVPEAFFRSCRSISQSGNAQFVFSGERRIANRLWDAQSPHWNFCRAVQLTQLERDDAVSLLVEPLRSMNIQLPDQELFSNIAWARTSGHPQIVQFLGDRLVKLLDGREDRRDLAVSADDILQVTSTTEFAQHYLGTYWGQATKLEKVVSELVAASELTPKALLVRLQEAGHEVDSEGLLGALRMLQLYGIVLDVGEKIVLRAEWFTDALAHFGGGSLK